MVTSGPSGVEGAAGAGGGGVEDGGVEVGKDEVLLDDNCAMETSKAVAFAGGGGCDDGAAAEAVNGAVCAREQRGNPCVV